MEPFGNVFNGKNIFITGHTGFKGSWLALWLLELGANVTGYALDPVTKEDNFVVSGLSQKITDIRGDIRDFQKLSGAIKTAEPDIIFHLAAQPLVRLSYAQPRETYETNVMGTVNVLEAARRTPSVKCILNITSDKCYENREWVWGYRENDPMGGHDPYSSSKGCSELVTTAYIRSFFQEDGAPSLASVRAGNVIGGGDWAQDRLIPDCIRSLIQCKTIDIRNPHAIRPWQHVLEPLSGYLLLARKMLEKPHRYDGAWNFGPGPEAMFTVGEVADMVIQHWGKGQWRNLLPKEQLHEANLLALDTSKARMELGWKPRWETEEAVKKTIEWYRKWRRGDNLYEENIREIEEYIAS
jgi:CDP-glucose 4,6-dehydratase